MVDRVLMVPEDVLDLIQEDETKVSEQCYRVLRYWKERYLSDATYRRLVLALQDPAVDRVDLIKKYCGLQLVSRPLEDLVNDASDYLDNVCNRLDRPLAGRGNYEHVAKHYGYDVFTIQCELTKSDCPSKALISSIIAKHPGVTIENFAKVVVEQTRREDVARLLREFDCK
ncbi:uncharacterized protein LOC122955664 [Acropora millepora]|uniref:uncharacterized protein LOC122955664 n=1 Tax=Acropora millepora TaxID=45264 RepID=UPI001CF4171A|nr:uncharacterized protein LOC122955664 [Acropora millepora]